MGDTKNTGKSWLTDELKLAYNKGTKKAVHSSEWRPKNLNSKIVTFAVVGGWLFFVPINITSSTPNAIINESIPYVLMSYHLHRRWKPPGSRDCLHKVYKMIKILFVCHGNILKSPGKAWKINGFKTGKGAYYTTTTPFLNWVRALIWQGKVGMRWDLHYCRFLRDILLWYELGRQFLPNSTGRILYGKYGER